MARGGALALSPVCAYVAERSGSSLSEQQVNRLRELLQTRIKGADEGRYVEWLKTTEGAGTLAELMASIAVHKTDLFRDEVQLDAFVRHVLQPLVRSMKRPLHLWSAGCATGEEVATLLILLQEAGAHPQSTVLGTDISDHALRQARAQRFHPELFRRVPPALRKRYFTDDAQGYATITPELSDRARFARHNLMDRPYPLSPLGGAFDLIFCRNVLIYFTEKAFDATVDGLAERLQPQGTLVLSAAEPLLRARQNLVTVRFDQAFFYRKTENPPAARAWGLDAGGGDRGTGQTWLAGRAGIGAARPAATFDAGKGADPYRSAGVPGGVNASAARTVSGEQPFDSASAAARSGSSAASSRPVGAQSPNSASSPYLPRTITGEQALATVPSLDDPREEAAALFELVLGWAAADEADQDTEGGLRRCLYLDPHLAQARYLLGMLLEQRGAKADAAGEYRRALSALNEGRSRATAFFLNDERLKTACARALDRLGFPR